jgi:anti-sigma factor RsiW
MNIRPGTPIDDDHLHDYLDGLLTPAERTALEADLRADAHLRSQLETVRNHRDALRTVVRLEAPDADFSKKLMAAWVQERHLATQTTAPRDWRALAAPLALGSLLLLLVGFVVVSLLTSGVATASSQAPSAVVSLPSVPLADLLPALTHPAVWVVAPLVLGLFFLKICEKIVLRRAAATR